MKIKKILLNSSVRCFSLFPRKVNIYIFNHVRNLQGLFGIYLRFFLLKNIAQECGDRVFIFPGVYFFNLQNAVLGSDISIHSMCYIEAFGGLHIGNNVSIAHSSSILTTNHSWKNESIPIRDNEIISKSVLIEDDIWIGCGCRILAGVRIAKRSIIAAGSVVNQNVESNTIVGGVPAKVISNLGSTR